MASAFKKRKIVPCQVQVKKRKRDKAVKRAGEALYGDMYMGAIGKQDRSRGGSDDTVGPWLPHEMPRHGPDELPKNFKRASAFAKARQRWRTFVRQQANVIHWLQHQHQIDMSPESFNPKNFEAFFKKHVPAHATTPQDRRKQAVAKVLKTKRPGRGGNCSWRDFLKLVERSTGKDLKFDLKTVQRDVRELQKKR